MRHHTDASGRNASDHRRATRARPPPVVANERAVWDEAILARRPRGAFWKHDGRGRRSRTRNAPRAKQTAETVPRSPRRAVASSRYPRSSQRVDGVRCSRLMRSAREVVRFVSPVSRSPTACPALDFRLPKSPGRRPTRLISCPYPWRASPYRPPWRPRPRRLSSRRRRPPLRPPPRLLLRRFFSRHLARAPSSSGNRPPAPRSRRCA